MVVLVDFVLSTLELIHSFRYIEQRSYRHFSLLLSVVRVETEHCLLVFQFEELQVEVGRSDLLFLLSTVQKIKHPRFLD